MRWYRKKPVAVEAEQLSTDNATDTVNWINEHGGNATLAVHAGSHIAVEIDTLEGTMVANVGDWVIMGVAGEFYPCKDSIFSETYEAVH